MCHALTCFLFKAQINTSCRIEIFEADLLDLKINLKIIKTFENDISGIFWVAGFTGNPEIEYSKAEDAEKNLMVNCIYISVKY